MGPKTQNHALKPTLSRGLIICLVIPFFSQPCEPRNFTGFDILWNTLGETLKESAHDMTLDPEQTGRLYGTLMRCC